MKSLGPFVAIFLMLLSSSANADNLLASLDAALASGDVQNMVAILTSHPDKASQMEAGQWLKDKIDHGQASDSFSIALSPILASQGDVEGALTYLDYFAAVSFIDIDTCPDASFRGAHAEGVIFISALLRRKLNVDPAQARNSVKKAMALEAATAGKRRVDPSLCGGGRIAYSNPHGLPLPDAPPDKTGSRRKLWSATGPLYIDDPAWRAKRSAALPNLESLLLTIDGMH